MSMASVLWPIIRIRDCGDMTLKDRKDSSGAIAFGFPRPSVHRQQQRRDRRVPCQKWSQIAPRAATDNANCFLPLPPVNWNPLNAGRHLRVGRNWITAHAVLLELASSLTENASPGPAFAPVSSAKR